jgi:hypothetical protein
VQEKARQRINISVSVVVVGSPHETDHARKRG